MLKIGLSTYSMQKAIDSGRMDVIEVMRLAKEIGASKVELVPLGCKLHEEKEGEFIDSLLKSSLLMSKLSISVIRFTTIKQANLTIRASNESSKNQNLFRFPCRIMLFWEIC